VAADLHSLTASRPGPLVEAECENDIAAAQVKEAGTTQVYFHCSNMK
jgi:hypothetical protein